MSWLEIFVGCVFSFLCVFLFWALSNVVVMVVYSGDCLSNGYTDTHVAIDYSVFCSKEEGSEVVRLRVK